MAATLTYFLMSARVDIAIAYRLCSLFEDSDIRYQSVPMPDNPNSLTITVYAYCDPLSFGTLLDKASNAG